MRQSSCPSKRNRRLLSELKAHKFYPTIDACNVWFSIINDEVFRNKLSPVNFSIMRMRGTWGYYEDSQSLVVLNQWFPSKNLFLNILSHEMIHAHQHQQGLDVNHGRSFWIWRKRFKTNGLSLALKYDSRSSIVVG